MPEGKATPGPVDLAFTRPGGRDGTIAEPTFSGALSFMRRRYTKDVEGADIAVVGIEARVEDDKPAPLHFVGRGVEGLAHAGQPLAGEQAGYDRKSLIANLLEDRLHILGHAAIPRFRPVRT